MLKVGHNPYFNRWFSAMIMMDDTKKEEYCHNPYFNRWFSAIWENNEFHNACFWSQSLF